MKISKEVINHIPLAIPSLCQQEEQQIQAILQQTIVSDTKYTDNEINHLINPQSTNKNNRPSVKNSIHSQFSAPSQSDENFYLSRDNSLGSDHPKILSRNQSSDEESNGFDDNFDIDRDLNFTDQTKQVDINQIFVDQFIKLQSEPDTQRLTPSQRFEAMKSRKNFPYTQIYDKIQYLQKPFTMQQVQKQYPSFLISKPSYKIESTVKQKRSAFNASTIKSSFSIIDIASPNKNVFYMAAGTNSNTIIVYEIHSTKPHQIIQVFKPGQKVKSLKWSESLQYLIVSNQNNQVKMFQFRQFTLPGESQQPMKWMKTPVQVFSLIYPKIKANIIDFHFIQENPVKVLLVDEEYEIDIVEMKKHFLGFKPSVTKLPIKFSAFFQLKLIKLSNTKQNYGTLMVVGGQDYVTLTIIQPKFEIVLVYDKEKHFPQAKRGGYPNIMFVSNQKGEASPEIMIVWDKHMEVIKLKIQEFQPLTYKIQTILKYTFPDSSILVGNLSSTLIYQLTRLELKIYSLNEISKFNLHSIASKNSEDGLQRQERIKFAQPIYTKKIDFEEFSQGQRLEEIISNTVIELQDLIILKNFLSVSSNTLFICFEQFLYSVSIESFPSYVQTTIQSINDWKVGLQLINDGISKQITQFYLMNEKILRKQLKEYSSRYIEFLKGVIPDTLTNNQIWKQEMCFLFNILIRSGEQKYLVKEILIKLYRISPQLLKIYEPFILMGHLTQIDVDTFDLLLSVIQKQVGRRIIYSIKNSLSMSEDHSELAHLINNILIRYELYLELIWINQFFADYYTPFVILISKYEQNYSKKDTQIRQHLEALYETEHKVKPDKDMMEERLVKFKQEKASFVKLLGYLSFDTFRLINLSEYNRFFAQEDKFHISKVKAKYLIETLVPIMHSKLNRILINNCPEQLFNYILEQMFYGNSLNVLIQFDSGEKSSLGLNFRSDVVENLPYKLIVQVTEQGKYWLFVMRLMIRKIISRKVIPGLFYLTLEYPHQSNTLILLVDLFVKECSKTVNEELYSIDEEKKTEFFEKLKNTENIELLRLIGSQLNRQMEVLQCMIRSKRWYNVELIEYMTQILAKASHITKNYQQQILSKLKILLKRNIKLFTSIDPEKTSNFIITNFKTELKQFISYLEETPKEQLNLLKQILTHYNYGEFLNNQKCKFLELLAITGQKEEILDQIKSHMFPLDEAIEICKKYEILDAWAFLLVKSGGTGNSTLAIEIYFRMIRQHIEKYKYNRKTYERWQELKTSMLNQLNKCIQVCIELDIKGYHHEETEWFFIIEQLETLKKYTYKTCSPDVESSVREIILQTLYPQLIKQLLDQVPTQIILSYLKNSMPKLQPQASELIIQQIVKACSHQKQILKNAQQQISQSEIFQRKLVVQETLKGFLTTNRCYECAKQDIHTKIHYSCGHDIHPECNQDVKECISCRKNEEMMLWRQVNLKYKVQKVIFYNPPDPNKDKTESEIIRLSRQQRLRKFDEAMQSHTIVAI